MSRPPPLNLSLFSLASSYDALHKSASPGQGLQNGSASVMNMKGSDFVRQAAAVSDIEEMPARKVQARSALSALAKEYAVLQEKNLATPQMKRFFRNASPADSSWVDSEQSVKDLLRKTEELARHL